MSRIAALILGVALLGCGADDAKLPEAVCGRWVTDDAKYAGRYLALSNESLRFGHGDEELSTFRVVGIQREERGGDVRYDVTYLDATEEESVFSFEHQVACGRIRISHSPGRRWKKWATPVEPPLDSEIEPEAAPEPKTKKKAGNPER